MDIHQLLDKFRDKTFSGAAIDSRLIKENEVFFALQGEKVDGHNFLQEVAQKKGAAAVVSKRYRGDHHGLLLIFVEDVLMTLHSLAGDLFKERKTRCIAVTGSVGKTTTKEFIATLLQKKFRIAKTLGTFNSQATFPLSILNSSGDEEIFVMEMGMSRPGEIHRLVSIAPPDIAFVGRLALAHVASFPDGIEGIALAKAEILSHPETRFAILHEETSHYSPFRSFPQEKVIRYAYPGMQLVSRGKEWIVIEHAEESPQFSIPFSASHLRENLLGAITVARSLGMKWEEILPQIDQLTLIPRRFEKIEKEGALYINDAYNANPTSMKAALENLPKPSPGGKKIGVLGEMRELGPFSRTSHREIGKIALQHLDELLCYGEECIPLMEVFEKEGKPVKFFTELSLLKKEMANVVRTGDVVLIKGSNSKQMWKLLE